MGPTLTRRHLMGLAGGAAVLAATGCTRPEPGAGSGGTGGGGTVRIGMISSNPQYEPFFRDRMQQLGQSAGITVDTVFYPPADYANAMQLAFQSDDAPDIYRMTGPTPALNLSNSARNNWLHPLDDFLTDEFRSRPFPAGTFDRPEASGLHLDGQLLALPLESLPYTQIRILYCNTQLLADAGIAAPPTTYGELAEAARAVQGRQDRTYGFAIAGQQTVVTVDALQSTGGVPMAGLAPINYQNGTAGGSDSSYVTVVDLLRQLNAEGVLTPGWESWDGTRPITEFAAGRLAMYVGANFHAAQIRSLAPDLEFQLADIPVPDDGRKGYMPVRGLNIGYWGMNANAADPEAAWTVLDHLSTVDFQRAAYDELKLIPVFSDALADSFSGDTLRMVEIMEQTQRLAPAPVFKGQANNAVVTAATADAPTPNITELYTAAITNNTDYAGPAGAFDTGFNAVLTAEIESQGLGADALAFPDWNPMEDYQG